METTKRVNGVKVTHYRTSPLENLRNIGKALETKKRLEAAKVGIPKYTEEEKEQIKQEAIKRFNLKGEN
jgi:hypothetical protein